MVPGYHRPTNIYVNCQAIYNNIKNTIERLPAQTELFAVVKADAYGHGAIKVAEIAKKAGATGFCVAILDEALELRAAGFQEPILVLEVVAPDYIELLIEQKISVTVTSVAWLQEANRIFQEKNKRTPIKIHIKLDTGMGRIGFVGKNEMEQAQEVIFASNAFDLEGIFTHFSTADGSDEAYFEKQQQSFAAARALFPNEIRYIHTANTATALWHNSWGSNMVRFGLSIYGLNPSGRLLATPFPLEEALTLESELIQVKQIKKGDRIGYGAEYEAEQDEWLGTVPIGYADGLRRDLQGFSLLVEGEKAPIVGRICMDQCMIRLPQNYPTGTKVTIIGKNGSLFNSSQDLAEYVGTINYEIPCELTARIPRIYTNEI